MTPEELIKRFDKLKIARGTWENHWQELAAYFLPLKRTTKVTPGTKLPTELYDGTAAWAVQIFAAGLHSYLTNPSSKWFSLGLKEEDLETQDVKEWLKEVTEKIFDTLNSSNFNQQLPETYLDYITFGTACLYEEKDPKSVVRFYTRPISEIFIVENAQEIVDTVFRYFTLTVRQAYGKWGDGAGETVMKAYEAKDYEKPIDFLHVVLPRDERDASKKDALNMPFASLYIEYSKKHLISEGGYNEFPFFVPRFIKISGKVYGYSTSMVALPDVKTLNTMSKTILRAAQKMVDPPLQGPDDGYILPLNLTPGAVNYKRAGTIDEFKVLYETNYHNIPVGREMENQRREQIKQALFVDLFLLLAQKPQMTATEVLERVEEKMLILAPVLGRLMSELLQLIIERTFAILVRDGAIEVPDELQDKEYTIEYISPLARAQKISEIKSINNFISLIRQMMEVQPVVVDNINFDKAAKDIADIYNVNPAILRDDDEVARIRSERAELEEAQRQAEDAMKLVDAYQKIAGVEKKE